MRIIPVIASDAMSNIEMSFGIGKSTACVTVEPTGSVTASPALIVRASIALYETAPFGIVRAGTRSGARPACGEGSQTFPACAMLSIGGIL